MSKVKVGDVVRRWAQYRTLDWAEFCTGLRMPHGGSFTVTAVLDGGVILDGCNGHMWDPCHFEVVSVSSIQESAPKAPDSVGTGMKYDAGKPRMDLLLDGCPNALLRISDVLTFGAKKYAAHSWHTVAEGKSRYKAALLRHLTAHAMGEVNDAESGLPHLAHAACCALFILELEQRDA